MSNANIFPLVRLQHYSHFYNSIKLDRFFSFGCNVRMILSERFDKKTQV